MNIWTYIGIIITWIIIDIFRYAHYLICYNKLNKAKSAYENISNEKNVIKFFDDMQRYPELIEDNIKDLYYSKVNLEDMNFADVCEALYCIIGAHSQYIEIIKKIIKKLQINKVLLNKKNIFTSNKIHNRLANKNKSLHSWFIIFPIFIIIKGIHIITHYYLKILGYKYYTTKHGLNIWYTTYDHKKGTPLIFFHGSIGGLSFYCPVFKYFRDNYNIIMPELPGISFMDAIDPPPSFDDMIDDVYIFIMKIYINKNIDVRDIYDNANDIVNDITNDIINDITTDIGNDITNDIVNDINKINDTILDINLMGHSLGNTLCCGFINKYPKLVNNFFCIEGHIFYNRGLKIFSDFESIYDIPVEDFYTIIFFQRNLYVQYFINKQLSLDKCFIYDLADNDTKQIKIHMFHGKHDERLLIQPQLDYALKKKIPISYHIFEKNHKHGLFIMNRNFKNYVISKIHETYEKNINGNIMNRQAYCRPRCQDKKIKTSDIVLLNNMSLSNYLSNELSNDLSNNLSNNLSNKLSGEISKNLSDEISYKISNKFVKESSSKSLNDKTRKSSISKPSLPIYKMSNLSDTPSSNTFNILSDPYCSIKSSNISNPINSLNSLNVSKSINSLGVSNPTNPLDASNPLNQLSDQSLNKLLHESLHNQYSEPYGDNILNDASLSEAIKLFTK